MNRVEEETALEREVIATNGLAKHVCLETGLVYPDGDDIELYLLTPIADPPVLSDCGMTINFLLNSEGELSSLRRQRIEAIANDYGATLVGGALQKQARGDLAQEAHALGLACARVAGLPRQVADV